MRAKFWTCCNGLVLVLFFATVSFVRPADPGASCRRTLRNNCGHPKTYLVFHFCGGNDLGADKI